VVAGFQVSIDGRFSSVHRGREDNTGVPTVFWFSTALFIGCFAWSVTSLVGGRPIARSRSGTLGAAYIFFFAGWQAVTWLQSVHPNASQIRYAAVWIQAVCCFGVAVVAFMSGRRMQERTAVEQPAVSK
jgi:fucose 4-O-acetylase-like acetyltransferase